jgi:exocyst complex component 2
MDDLQRTLLNHYKIDSLYPAEWPTEKDNEDSSDEDESSKRQATASSKRISRAKSRYSVLERNPRLRTSVPGSQKNKDGVENLVQKDEPDPLGGQGSVVQTLRQRGLPVDDDLKLRM